MSTIKSTIKSINQPSYSWAHGDVLTLSLAVDGFAVLAVDEVDGGLRWGCEKRHMDMVTMCTIVRLMLVLCVCIYIYIYLYI